MFVHPLRKEEEVKTWHKLLLALFVLAGLGFAGKYAIDQDVAAHR